MPRACLTVLVIAFALGLVATGAAEADAVRGPALLVIPAQETMVELALDLAWLGPLSVIAYDMDRKHYAIHAWHAVDRRWVPATIEGLSSGTLFRERPARVIVVGSDDAMLDLLARAVSWCPDVETLDAPAFADVANACDESLRLTAREWRWLAPRHGLKIRDLNLKRRRYGRYGPPGESRPVRGRPAEDPAEIVWPERLPEPELLPEPASPQPVAGDAAAARLPEGK